VTPRAIVFDLWETLVDWPHQESLVLRQRWSERLGIDLERLDELWYEPAAYRRRESGPLAPLLRVICEETGSSADVDELIEWRVEMTRRFLVPRDGVLETIAQLRSRGRKVGLISNCTEDVVLAWEHTRLSGVFDAVVFSAQVGCVKPEPEIYELVCEALGVPASECVFVGDGANDELGGAERIGMTPVLIHRAGEAPPWDGLRDWPGLRVTSIPEVLALVA
jgi:HAD superfamily hydrolase (TIGR01509 family)